MHIHHRRILVLVFTCIFLLGGPALILYATGYRYNLKTHQIVKSALLVAQSSPRRASVILDGQETGSITDTVLRNVSAGTHMIEIQKEGYFRWNKTLAFSPTLATFVSQQLIMASGTGTPILNRMTYFAPLPDENAFVYREAADPQFLRLWNVGA